jgi:hypothetical protein
MAKLASVGQPERAVLGHRALHDLREHGRKVGDEFCDRCGFGVHDQVHHGMERLRFERLSPTEQLVQDRAQREDIGSGIHALAPDLLRGHVVGRADHESRARDVRPEEPSQPEVHDLGPARGKEMDVCGLQVTVHDSVPVREGQALCDLG